MKTVYLLYTVGVIAAAAAGFLSPAPYLGLVAISAGALWAAYDLAEVRTDADTARTTPRRHR